MSAAVIEANIAADLRSIGNAELQAHFESLQYELAGAADHDPHTAEVIRHLYERDLRLAEAELARRERLHAAGNDVPDPNAPDYHAWRDLAREIRERADIVTWLQTAGCKLTRAGREWAGSCPFCHGHDRFRVWSAADGKRPGFWCRQCDISGDVIAAYRLFVVPGASFFDAVSVLAAELGLRTPDFGRNCSQSRLGTIRKTGATMRKNSSQRIGPLSERKFGNNPRRPAVRFDHGRAVAS